MKKLILTGGSGGVGLAIIKKLIKEYEINIFDRTHGVDFMDCDINTLDLNCDVLILNSGVWDKKAYEMFKINFYIQFLIAQRVFKNWKEKNIKGHMIFVLSNAAYKDFGNTVYSMTKAGLKMMADRLFEDGIKHGIKISYISPGTINTDFWKDAKFDNRDKCIPIEPNEIANSIDFILKTNSIVKEMVVIPNNKNEM